MEGTYCSSIITYDACLDAFARLVHGRASLSVWSIKPGICRLHESDTTVPQPRRLLTAFEIGKPYLRQNSFARLGFPASPQRHPSLHSTQAQIAHHGDPKETRKRSSGQILPSRQRKGLPCPCRLQAHPTEQKIRLPATVKMFDRSVCRSRFMDASSGRDHAGWLSHCRC